MRFRKKRGTERKADREGLGKGERPSFPAVSSSFQSLYESMDRAALVQWTDLGQNGPTGPESQSDFRKASSQKWRTCKLVEESSAVALLFLDTPGLRRIQLSVPPSSLEDSQGQEPSGCVQGPLVLAVAGHTDQQGVL